MIKKYIKCEHCGTSSKVYLKPKEIPQCLVCESIEVKVLYRPLKLQNDEIGYEIIGELSEKYIEENKYILESMKREKLKWNS